jgi:hypothetical protein
MNLMFRAVGPIILALASLPAWSQDRADIDKTQIIGNRELPKVLYIVPWKKPLPGDLAGRPAVSVLDEALTPIDRDVFRRQIQFDAMTRAQPAAAAAAPAAKPCFRSLPSSHKPSLSEIDR